MFTIQPITNCEEHYNRKQSQKNSRKVKCFQCFFTGRETDCTGICYLRCKEEAKQEWEKEKVLQMHFQIILLEVCTQTCC